MPLIAWSVLVYSAALIAAFPEDGDKRYTALQNDVAMGADLKGLSTLTPAEMAAKVESYKPTAVQGATDQYDRYNAVAGAAQRTLTQRAQDPRQYMIDNNMPFLGFDSDRSHGALLRFYSGFASPVLIDSYESLDAIVEAAVEVPERRILVDLAAQTRDLGFSKGRSCPSP